LKKEVRRWHHWDCYQCPHRKRQANAAIRRLQKAGFKAKVWAPLPQHKTSGHIHVSVLCRIKELLKLAGVET